MVRLIKEKTPCDQAGIRIIETLIHLLQCRLQPLHARSKAPCHQLSDAVSVTIDDIMCGAAAVVAVQRGSTLQADWQVTGLAEEAEILARMEGAQDRAEEATSRLQILQTLDRVSCRPPLTPADTQQTHLLQPQI